MTEIETLIKFKFQEEFQFGTRVETICGKKGIVNYCCESLDKCRVYYDEGGKANPIMVKISECRILSLEEAVLI